MAKTNLSYFLVLVCIPNGIYSATCPDGFEASLSDIDKCYLFISIPKSWFDAARYCTTYANNLVSVHSRGENLNVLATVSSSATIDRCDSHNFWIGGNDLAGKGTLTWIDGQTWDYNTFNSTQGQPHYETNGCVSSQITKPISASSWQIESADSLNCFVCEYFISSGPLTTTSNAITTTSNSLATGTDTAATTTKSLHTTTTPINSLCTDKNLENEINFAVINYSSNITAIAWHIGTFLSSNSMYKYSEFTIIVDQLQQSSDWNTEHFIAVQDYLCLFTSNPSWYISIVGIFNHCTNDEESGASSSTLALVKRLPLNSGGIEAVQLQAKIYDFVCQDPDLLNTIKSTISQSLNAASVAKTLSNYMITNYRKPGLCNTYIVQVIKNDVLAYSLKSLNSKRFCLLFFDQWTITVVSDTCSSPQSHQGTTTTASNKALAPLPSSLLKILLICAITLIL